MMSIESSNSEKKKIASFKACWPIDFINVNIIYRIFELIMTDTVNKAKFKVEMVESFMKLEHVFIHILQKTIY